MILFAQKLTRETELQTCNKSGADAGFGQGGTPVSEAENCWHREAELYKQSEPFAAGVQGPLKALEVFGFLMPKYEFFHILETLFLSFLTSTSTPKDFYLQFALV